MLFALAGWMAPLVRCLPLFCLTSLAEAVSPFECTSLFPRSCLVPSSSSPPFSCPSFPAISPNPPPKPFGLFCGLCSASSPPHPPFFGLSLFFTEDFRRLFCFFCSFFPPFLLSRSFAFLSFFVFFCPPLAPPSSSLYSPLSVFVSFCFFFNAYHSLLF